MWQIPGQARTMIPNGLTLVGLCVYVLPNICHCGANQVCKIQVMNDNNTKGNKSIVLSHLVCLVVSICISSSTTWYPLCVAVAVGNPAASMSTTHTKSVWTRYHTCTHRSMYMQLHVTRSTGYRCVPPKLRRALSCKCDKTQPILVSSRDSRWPA